MLTIVVPVYNTKFEILDRCINSLLEIKDIDIEILIIDDGSSESYSRNYKDLKEKNKCIKYIRKENGGVSSARNVGIINATKKYIMFVDSDDIINGRNILKSDISSNEDLIIYDYVIDKNGKQSKYQDILDNNVTIEDVLRSFSISNGFHSPCYKLYKTEILKSNNLLFSQSFIHGEDAIFNYEYLRLNPSLKHIPKVLYCYYYTQVNEIKRWKSNENIMLENFEKLIDIKKNIIFDSKYKFDSKVKCEFYNKMVELFFQVTLKLYYLKKNNLIQKITNKLINDKIDIKCLKLTNKIKFIVLVHNIKLVYLSLNIIKKLKGQY